MFAGVVAGVEVANGDGHSIKNLHLVFVKGAKTINLASDGLDEFLVKEPEPIPAPLTSGKPESFKSWL